MKVSIWLLPVINFSLLCKETVIWYCIPILPSNLTMPYGPLTPMEKDKDPIKLKYNLMEISLYTIEIYSLPGPPIPGKKDKDLID